MRPISLLKLYQSVQYLYFSDLGVQEVIVHEPKKTHGRLPESLVHYIWKHQLFDTSNLRTVQGDEIVISDVGTHNTLGSGADFFMARIRIGQSQWIGDVEIHVHSSEYLAHKHHHDPAYNRVVLHVTLFEDSNTGKLTVANHATLPELYLLPHLQTSLQELLYDFHTNPDQDFLCQSQWYTIPKALLEEYVPQLGFERIQDKARMLRTSEGFDQKLYENVMMALGYSQNRNAMQVLAQRVPISLLQSLHSLSDREAVLLGTAGLLPETAELLDCDRETADVITDWQERFERLRYRYELIPLQAQQWHFSGLRPANFPTLRLAQAASLFSINGLFCGDVTENMLHAISQAKTLKVLKEALQSSPSAFWNTHFGVKKTSKSTKSSMAQMGTDRANIILINALLPAYLHLADYLELPHLRPMALELMQQMPKNEDHITRYFAHPSWKPTSATDYQGLHQLYRTRCINTRCLDCAIGQSLLKQPESKK